MNRGTVRKLLVLENNRTQVLRAIKVRFASYPMEQKRSHAGVNQHQQLFPDMTRTYLTA